MKFLSKLVVVLIVLLSISSLLLGAGNDRIEQEIQELKRIQDSNNKILAETVQGLSEIRQQLQELRGGIEEAKHFVQEGTVSNEKMVKDFDLRITNMEEKVSAVGSQMQDFLSKKGIVTAPPSPTTTPTTLSPDPNLGDDEDSLYRRALVEINNQNSKMAFQLFDQFLKKFPQSKQADSAQYWKAEALYALKDYPNAVIEFQKVVKKYPKSNKVAGAVLKQGYCFYESKEYLDAKAFLEKVIKDFPRSQEAKQAKERIQKINQILARK